MSCPSPVKRPLSSASMDADGPSKRCRTQLSDDEDGKAASATICRLMDSLRPVRTVLWPFIGEAEAACLMQLSRAFISAVLGGFRFLSHPFTVHSRRQLRVYQSLADCITITCMQLAADFTNPLWDNNGDSLLPSTLIALMLGPLDETTSSKSIFSVAHEYQRSSEMSGRNNNKAPWREGINRLLQEAEWPFPVSAGGAFNLPLPPHSLPHGLCFLAFGHLYNQPLHLLSIPSTVLYLQFNACFFQKLHGDQLPDSVQHVAVCWGTNADLSQVDGRRYRFSSPTSMQRYFENHDKRIRFIKQCWRGKAYCTCHGYCLQEGSDGCGV